MASLLVIAGAVGAYLAFPRLSVRYRCVDWPDHKLPGLETGKEYLFVAMGACNTVIAIDTRSHTVVAATRLEGSFPHGIAVNLAGRELYVANERSDDVSVISLPDLISVVSILVGDFPTDVVPSMDGKRMFVANFKGGSVQVIDLIGRSVTREVTGPRATHFAVSPDGERLYVTHWDQNRLSILDGRDGALIKTFTLTGKPNHATVSRGSRRIYTTLYGNSALAVIDAARP
ncbi:MAG: YncE family protein [Acidobacteria bacterium]|nr:YncE family protein [Acidobacteriota bacterium]